MTLFLQYGKWLFKCQIWKRGISLNHLLLMMDCGFNTSATLTLFVPELPELLSIILLLGSINYDIFWEKNLLAHMVYTPLNRDIIFYMSVKDTTIIGIQEGTLLVIFLNSSYITAMLLHLRIALFYQITSI